MNLAIGIACIEAYLHKLIQFIGTITFEREAVVLGIDGNTLLCGIATRKIVGSLIVTTLQIQIVVLRQTCTEDEINPIGADDVAILIGHSGIRKIVGVATIIQPTTILDISILLGIHRGKQLCGTIEAQVVVVGKLGFTSRTRISSDEHNTCCCTRTIHSTGGSIL